ncbi:MAG: COX15/CtaA family protein [Cycloclasticus sp.]|nr:COX15/CtaA family protein [Cycloclasticus sp.]MBQ0790700.1 COX15/CtaA family protein [Cycloclasticus sp.]
MFRKLTIFAILLALFVVVLGAYVRLSDAGLGCPDWPGCYGNLIIEEGHDEVLKANEAFSERPFEASKAWKEMIHRYFASGLGLVILILMVIAWRRPLLGQRGLTISLFLLVVFQGALGMWTVTLLVKPAIVVSHLLGGLATLSLLFWLLLRLNNKRLLVSQTDNSVKSLAKLGLVVLIAQIALGGWTSTNYAALACPDFPACFAGNWTPSLDYSEGFVLWRGLGVDYEFGVLSNEARAAIHWVHRLGAIVTTIILAYLAAKLFKVRARKEGGILLTLLCTQVMLGILNVVLSLPLSIAVAHNGIAALLLLSMVYVNFRLKQNRY